LVATGYSTVAIAAFRDAFLHSERPSVDDFLSRRRDYLDVGKAAMAGVLLQCEDGGALNGRGRLEEKDPDHWYMYLWDRICSGATWETIGENRLSIVTFNYDRSLEQYLLTSMRHTFDKPIGECREKLAFLDIIHVYGKLGALASLSEHKQSRPYETTLTPEHIKIAAKGIHLIDEREDGATTFDDAEKAFLESRRICFLGFGFDETNIRRLRLRNLLQPGPPDKEAYGTTVGLLGREIDIMLERLGASAYNNFFRPLRSGTLLRTLAVLA
jgi:hypothetical protein